MKFIHDKDDVFLLRHPGLLVFLVALVFLWILLLFPLPVHKVNNACCSADSCATQHHHEKQYSELKDQSLQILYADLNRDYYLGQLPQNVEVKWGDLTENHWMGITHKRPDGSFLITIDRATNPTWNTAYLTTSHETCHLANWNEPPELTHGPKFQNCMVGLANKGAFEGIW